MRVRPKLAMPALELHIEELVLEGIAPGDRFQIADAIESELTQLLERRGVPPSLIQTGAIESLNARPVHSSPISAPKRIGSKVAESLYNGLAAMTTGPQSDSPLVTPTAQGGKGTTEAQPPRKGSDE